MRRQRHATGLLLLAAAGVAAGSPANGETVGVERTAQEHVARTRAGDCAIALEYRLDGGSLTYRNDCAQSLDEKGRSLETLLTALFGAGPLPEPIRSLGIGRMILFSEEMSLRMALDAHADPGWSEALRRRRAREADSHGVTHDWVRAWIEESTAYAPLAAPLRARGATLHAGAVEKVLITPPAPTALGEALGERGVPADAHLPFDAQVWLVLERAAPPAASTREDAR